MPSGLRALHAWLDTWHGIGLIEHGLARQDRDLELIRYGDRWGSHAHECGRPFRMTPRWASNEWDSESPVLGRLIRPLPATTFFTHWCNPRRKRRAY